MEIITPKIIAVLIVGAAIGVAVDHYVLGIRLNCAPWKHLVHKLIYIAFGIILSNLRPT